MDKRESIKIMTEALQNLGLNDDIVSIEIARELIYKEGGNYTDLENIWPLCEGNPWDAPILYTIIKVKDQDVNPT